MPSRIAGDRWPMGVLMGFAAGPMARRALPEASWLGDLPLAPRKRAVRSSLENRAPCLDEKQPPKPPLQ
jgi:hypothetical protein